MAPVRDGLLGHSTAGACRRPVFLHGMWRSGTTYVWSRFRAAPGAHAFYEPLHHGLAKLTRARIARDTNERVTAMGHPALEQPYFAEFEPLLSWRGVKKYSASFAFDRFALAPQDTHRPLQRYVGSLVEHAAGQGKTAIVGCNRTVFRIGWLRERFGPFDIHIDRDPYAIWRSYRQQMARGNYSFLTYWMMVLERNAEHPLFAAFARRLPLRGSPRQLMTKRKDFYRETLDRMSPEMSYAIVFYMWAIAALHALSYCDLVFDMNRLGDPQYLDDLVQAIRQGCGLDVSLPDARVVEGGPDNSGLDRLAVERAVAPFFPRDAFKSFVLPGAAQARFGELAPGKAEALGLIL
jgi:hypothetical protein